MKTTTNKIQDVDEFCKLYKLNIPVHEEFEYYFNLLTHYIDEFTIGDLEYKLEKFVELEHKAAELGFESVYKYKLSEVDRIKDFIMQTDAYKKFLEAPLPVRKMQSRDWLNQVSEDDYLVSLDFVSANYSVVKTFDNKNELLDRWATFAEYVDLHKALALSKSFRQVVFGNTNPKRLQTFQQDRMMNVYELLKTKGWKEEDFVFLSHDEIIFKISGIRHVNAIHHIYEELEKVAQDMPIKMKVFTLKKLKKNMFIKTYYVIRNDAPIHFGKSDALGFVDPVRHFLSKDKVVLHGVPGNKFYMYLKKCIFNQPLEERDLMYYNDGELCKWVDPDFKSAKKSLPHYDKPYECITTKEAKEQYSHIWDGLTMVLPDMTDEEKRRAIEVVANTCKYCYQNPSRCQCWNDE